jgi:hypothetical protein
LDKDLLKELIITQVKSSVNFNLPDNISGIVENWIGDEILTLVENTNRIKNEDVRVKSITIMFQKRFIKLQKLYTTLTDYELIENTALFEDLLKII